MTTDPVIVHRLVFVAAVLAWILVVWLCLAVLRSGARYDAERSRETARRSYRRLRIVRSDERQARLTNEDPSRTNEEEKQ